MAHALKRISYASCRPEQRQFAFVAREPRHGAHVDDPGAHYCHVYRTDDTRQADELNMIVGNAFRQAYVQQNEEKHIEEDEGVHDVTGRNSVETTHSPTTSSSSVQVSVL